MITLKYVTKKVNTVEEYITALNNGFIVINCTPEIKEAVYPILEKMYQDGTASDVALYDYCRMLDNRKIYELELEILNNLYNKGFYPAANIIAFYYFDGIVFEKDFNKSFEWYMKAAEQGFAPAQNNIGAAYRNGQGVEKDPVKAFEWYLKAANQGFAAAQRNLGNRYYYGNGVEKDYAKAFEWYMKAALQGYIRAQNDVGDCYRYGNGVEKDYAKAFEWYQKAALQGNEYAQDSLGDFYYSGYGIEQDYTKAFEWYLKAALQGNEYSQDSVGDCYYFGHGVEQDYVKAFEWYIKAAEQGLASSQATVGDCYHEGEGVEKDIDKAVMWLMKAAEQGNGHALENLGFCYEFGEGVEQDYAKAQKFYQRAIEKGEISAYRKIGHLYWHGHGVEHDPVKAFEWYMKGAEKDDPGAQYDVGYSYYYGIGVEKDKKIAFEWLMKSAEQGYPASQDFVGDYYYFGEPGLVEQDYKRALSWFLKASENDFAPSKYCIGKMYFYGQGVEIDYQKSFEWFMKAAEQGYARAQDFIGDFYYFEDPHVVDQDYAKAFEWYQKAAEQGLDMSQNSLAILYLNGYGVERNNEEALKWFQKAADQDYENAYCALGAIYEDGLCGEIDLRKALECFTKAQELGKSGIEEDIERIKQKISEQEHASYRVPEDIDVFISWCVKNLHEKEELRNILENEEIKYWESDTCAEGELDINVQYAINKAKCYVILVSQDALEQAHYMRKEIKMIFDRLERDELPKTLIRIYMIGDSNKVVESLKQLPDGDSFKLLDSNGGLTIDFSLNPTNVVTYVTKKVLEHGVNDYCQKIRKSFDTFLITATDIISKQGECEINPSLQFENGYINRPLLDESGHKIDSETLLKMHNVVLVYGEGGSGKSLYVKNLIHSTSDENKVFFYLPCNKIEEYLDKTNGYDLLDLISTVSVNDNRIVDTKIIRKIFHMEKEFYIVIDALDEAGNYKQKIVELAHTFIKEQSYNKHIHFIFTSRNKNDSSSISNIFSQEVEALQIRPMSDEDIVNLFDNIYKRNFAKLGTNTENKDNAVRVVNKDAFISNLYLIADDIKKNPLLISNLIYIYFVTREFQTQKSFILEKSNDLIINALEKDRVTPLKQIEQIKKLGIDINKALEFIAFRMVSTKEELESCAEQYIKTIADIDDQVVIQDRRDLLCKYLRERRIIIGNSFSHNIYLSFFAAKYIYNRLYKVEHDPDFPKDECVAFIGGGENKLLKYTVDYFNTDESPWSSITLDFIAKIDYEIHFVDKCKQLDSGSSSYLVFDKSMTILSNNLKEDTRALVKEMASNKNMMYYPDAILKYFN